MAFYGYGSGSSGGFYASPATPNVQSDDGGFSLGGLIDNFIGNVKRVVMGLPEGFKMMFTHPIRTAQQVGAAYKEIYGPVLHGDFTQLYENPLDVLLDVGAVASIAFGGAGVAARVGLKLGSTAAPVTSLYKFTSRGPHQTRAIRSTSGQTTQAWLSGNPYRRLWQRTGYGLSERLPGGSKVPLTNEWWFNRMDQRNAHRNLQRLADIGRRAEVLVNKVSSLEDAALTLRAQFGFLPDEGLEVFNRMQRGVKVEAVEINKILPEIDQRIVEVEALAAEGLIPTLVEKQLAALREQKRHYNERLKEIEGLQKALDTPGVQTAYLRPTRRMEEAERALRAVEDAHGQMLMDQKRLSKASRADRPFLVRRLLGGAKYVGPVEIKRRLIDYDKQLKALKAVGEDAALAVAKAQREAAAGLRAGVEASQGGFPLVSQMPRDGLGAFLTQADNITKAVAEEASRIQQVLRHEMGPADLKKYYDVEIPTGEITAKTLDDVAERQLSRINQLIGTQDSMMAQLFGQIDDKIADATAKGRIAEAQKLIETQMRGLVKNFEDRANILAMRRELEGSLPFLEGGPSPNSLRRLFEEAGSDAKPPFYMPHKSTVPRVSLAPTGGLKGSRPRPTIMATGLIASMGRFALDPRVLTREFLIEVKEVFKDDVFESIKRVSKEVDDTYQLGRGEFWVRHIRERPESYFSRTHPDIMHEYDALAEKGLLRGADDVSDAAIEDALRASTGDVRKDFITLDGGEAFVTSSGRRLVAKHSDAKYLAGEYARSSAALRWLFEKPLDFWRGLILGYRPAFLVNNLVGNHFLYAISYAGFDGLRAYGRMIGENFGERFAGQSFWKALVPFVGSKARKQRFIPESDFLAFMNTIFPEQMSQSFTASLAEGTWLSGVIGKTRANMAERTMKRLGYGIIPLTMEFAETRVRQAAIYAEILKRPEFVHRIKAMKGETESFWKAAQEELMLPKNRGLVNDISNMIDAALGNYYSLSNLERTVLRRAMPFYTWYRTITMVAFRLPFEYPGRATIIAKLGQLGYESTMDELGMIPEFMSGAVPLDDLLEGVPVIGRIGDDGRVPIFLTQGVNPFATVEDVTSAGLGLIGAKGGDPAAIASLTNPFFAAFAERITGRNILTGQEEKGVPGGLIGGLTYGVFADLPQVELFKRLVFGSLNEDKKLYRGDWVETLSSVVGAPLRGVNLDTAAFVRGIEQGELKEVTFFDNPSVSAPPKAPDTGFYSYS